MARSKAGDPMSRRTDEMRLVDDPSSPSEVRSLLQAGIEDEPDYDYASGLSAHLSAVAAVPPQPAPHLPAGASAGAQIAAGLSAKTLALIGASLASASIAGVLWLTSSAAPTTSVAARPSTAAPLHQDAPQPASQPADSPARAGSNTPASEAAPRTTSTETAEPRRRWVHSSAGRSSLDSKDHPLIEHLVLREEGDSAPSAPEARNGKGISRAAESAADPSSSRGTSTVATLTPSPEEVAADAARRAQVDDARRRADDQLSREMEALAATKRALADDPAEAVRLARQGNRDFPSGMFREERDHILILALIGLGRFDEAKQLAVPYLRNHPKSPFALRVKNALDAAAHSR
jgi:hypothetical protein